MEKNKTKESYEKPILRSIELTTEEMMGHCKMDAIHAGPVAPSCSFCTQNNYGS